MKIASIPKWIEESFKKAKDHTNGWERLAEIRETALRNFVSNGLPSVKEEEWRYTNLLPLFTSQNRSLALGRPSTAADTLLKRIAIDSLCRVVFVNGSFSPSLSTIPTTEGIKVTPLSEIFSQSDRHCEELAVLEELVTNNALNDGALVALNTAFLQEGAFIKVSKGREIGLPINIIYISDSHESFIAPRVIVSAESGSNISVIESFIGRPGAEALNTPLIQFSVQENARVDYCKLQLENISTNHISNLLVHQASKSSFRAVLISFGGATVRNEVRVLVDGQECSTVLNGLTVLGGVQQVDNHTVLDHAKPNCESSENFKGIYASKAKGAFSGTIIVRPDAQKTNAFQSNKSLLLSPDASIDTRPQLKIWADDVKCTHGATIGQIDEEALFYLRSRGLSFLDAQHMLIHAFASDIINTVENAELRGLLESELMRKLGEVSSGSASGSEEG